MHIKHCEVKHKSLSFLQKKNYAFYVKCRCIQVLPKVQSILTAVVT